MRIGRAAVLTTLVLLVILAFLLVRRPGVPPSKTSRDWTSGAVGRLRDDDAAREPGQGVLEGRVSYDGRPVAGATVTVTSAADGEAFSSSRCVDDAASSIFDCPCAPVPDLIGWQFVEGRGEVQQLGRVVTAADGTFRFSGAGLGSVAVWAEFKDLVAMQYAPSPETPVELILSPGLRFSGTVKNGRGDPLGGATVAAIHRLHSRFFTTSSDDSGMFQLGPLPYGPYSVIGWAAGHLPDVDSSPSGGMEIELKPARRLAGRVVRDGRPVPGAEVRSEVSCSPLSTTTDNEGRFVLERLRPEETTVSAFAGDQGGFAMVDLEASDPTDVVVELHAGGALVIEVRDEAGAPVPGTRATVQTIRPDVRMTAITGPDGLAKTLGLPPDEYSVWIHPPPGLVRPGRREVQITEGATAQAHYSLLRAAKFTGVVHDDRFVPVANAEISTYLARGGEPLPGDWDGQAAVTTRSDQFGRFSIDHAPPGRLHLSVEATGFLTEETSASAPGEVSVTLRHGGVLEVRVSDAAGGPVAGAHLTATTPHSEAGELIRLRARADATGNYTFSGLTSGKYRVVAQVAPPASHVPGSSQLLRTTARDVTIDAPKATSVHLQFDAGLSIVGRAVDEATGQPLAQVRVLARDEVEDPPTDPGSDVRYPEAGGSAWSDADGRFEIPHLRASPHRLVWFLEGYTLPEEPVVRPGKDTVLLKLRREPLLTGRVLDERGSPVTSYSLNGKPIQSSDGTFSSPISEAGPEIICLQSEGFALFVRHVVFTEGQSLALGDIRLSRGRDVKVLVTSGTPPRPVAKADVEAGLPDVEPGWSLSAPVFAEGGTGTDGRVLLRSVPAIPLHLLVSTSSIDSLAPALLPLPPDAREVTVTLGTGASIRGRVTNAVGQPVRNVQVTASNSVLRASLTAEDGRYIIAGLPGGVVHVQLEDALVNGNAGLSSRTITLPSEGVSVVDFAESRGATLTIRPDRPCRWPTVVRGEVPLTKAGIAQAEPHALQPEYRRDGGLLFHGLAPGIYTAICELPSRTDDTSRASSVRVEIATLDVEVALPEKTAPLH